MPWLFLPLIAALAILAQQAAGQITQSPTTVAIRAERGSFSVTYRSSDRPFEPGRGTLCTEVRDAYSGQTLGPGQLLGRPVYCSGRVLDRDPRPIVHGRRSAEPRRGDFGAGCELGEDCGVQDGVYRFRDRVRLGSGTAALVQDALSANRQGVVYWVREFSTAGYEVEGRTVALAVAVRPSGNALTGDLAVTSIETYVVASSGDRVDGAVRIDSSTSDHRLRARLRTSGSGKIDAYWVLRRPGQNSDRSTWRRVARVSFRTGAGGWQMIAGPTLGDLPLEQPGRYDVTLHFPPGARGVAAPEASLVTVWRPVR